MNVEQGISTIQKLIDTTVEFSVNYSFQVLGAIIIFVVGVIAGNWARNFFLNIFEKNKLDITLAHFLANTVRIIILAFAVLIALGKFGITIAPFIAVLGAAAFGATYAIQGPLSNYGAGISIILGRPFVVGDTITVVGVSGLVTEVRLACTILTNEDGVKITIPNKHIVGEILHNSKANSIVEGVVGVSYGANPEKAVRLVQEVLSQNKNVVREPAWQVGIQTFADSSINIGFRYWVSTTSYFKTSYVVNQAIYNTFQEHDIQIPFPQREVRIVGHEAKSGIGGLR